MTELYSFGQAEPRSIEQLKSLADATVSTKHQFAYKQVSYIEAQDYYSVKGKVIINSVDCAETFWQPVIVSIRAMKMDNLKMSFKTFVNEIAVNQLPKTGQLFFWIILDIKPKTI